MKRLGFRKSMVTCSRETWDYLDAVASTFEDKMPRGDLIDLLAEHARTHDLEDEIFGSVADGDPGPIEGEPPNVLSELRTQTEDRESAEPEDEEPEEEERPRPRRRSGGGVSLG